MTTKIKLSSNVGDVDISTTPTNGQALVYSTASSKWVPGAAAGGGVTTYSTIDDLPLSGVSEGALALVDSTNKLYLWMDTGWYNIATINTNPSITSGNDTPYVLALDGTPTVLNLVASDPEGIPITWSYEVTSGSLTNGGGTTATVSNDGDGQFTITPTTTEDYAGAFSITFKASDGVNLGTALSEFTLVFRVLDSKYTTLLVKAEETGSNATFVDGSTNAFTVTKNGDVTQGTFSPFSQPDGAWSNYFDGSGDYLTLTPDSSFAFGTSDFTVELWYYPTSAVTSEYLIDNRNASQLATWVFTYNWTGSNSGTLYWSDGSSALAQSSGSTTINAWNHIVYVRSGTTGSMYINGTRVATQTDSSNYSNTPLSSKIGDRYVNTASDQYAKGYISSFRIVNGTAVYDPALTTITVPTTPLTAITNTSLLTCQSNHFKDNSTNDFTITAAGNTSVSPVSPFDRLAYDPAVHGGGAYFDGTGDYLSATYSPSLMDWWSTDYTLEAWIYPTTFAGWSYTADGAIKPILIGNNNYSSTINYWGFGLNASGQLYFAYYNGAGVGVGTASTATLNAWNHIALVISGGSIIMYLNGVGTTVGSVSGTPLSSSGTALTIGAGNNTYINGYVSNLRIVKGTAVYTSDFTPPTEPLTAITNTSLLLNCDNGSIIDYSSKNNLKLVGNTTPSATQTKYAARSVYFDGSGDELTIAYDTALNITSGDFTIEFWAYLNTTSGSFVNTYYDSSTGWGISFNTGKFYVNLTGDGLDIDGTTGKTSGTWYHIAVSGNASTGIKLFVDGVQEGITFTGTITQNTSWPIRLGLIKNSIGNVFLPLNGYLSDLRITKGLARYTANFTPPTTELLG